MTGPRSVLLYSIIAAFVGMSCLAQPASAQAPTGTLLWWGGGGSGPAADGPGTWDTTSPWLVENPGTSSLGQWSSTPWINDGTWDAQIGWSGTPATITVTAPTPINVYNLSFGVGNNDSSGAYTVMGGTLNLSGGTITSQTLGTPVISSVLTGSNGLYKSGIGALLLTNSANSYTGPTSVAGGTLQLGVDNALPAATTLCLVAGQNSTFDLNGHSQQISGFSAAGDITSTITNSSPTLGTLTVSPTSSASLSTYGGTITGNLGLTKSGSGTLTLTALNSYTGSTQILGGTLRLSSNVPSDALIHYSFDTSDISGNQVINLGSGGSGLNGTMQNGVPTSGPFGLAISFSGTASGVVTNQKASIGNAYTLSAWVSTTVSNLYWPRIITNSYTASAYLGCGPSSAQYPNSYGLFTANNWNSISQSVDTSGAWHMVTSTWDGTSQSIYYDGVLMGSWNLASGSPGINSSLTQYFGFGCDTPGSAGAYGGSWQGGMDDSYVFTRALSAGEVQQLYTFGNNPPSNVLPATTAVQLAVGASLDLGGVNQQIASLSDSGGSGGSVTSSAPGPVTLTLGGGATTTFSGTLQDGAGVLALLKTGSGTQVLGGANSYSGGTTVSAGTLLAASDSALGIGPVTLTLSAASPAILAFTSATPSIGSLASSGTGSASVVLGNAATNTATLLTVGANNTSTTFSGTLGDLSTTASGAVGSLIKIGTGTLVLAGSDTYAGGTTVIGGTLVAASNSGLGSGPVILWPSSGTATLAFTSATPSIGSLASSGAGSASVVLGNAAANTATLLTVGANNTSTTFSGGLGDLSSTASGAVGSLLKTGTGILTLTGANTYSGSTSVNQGTLSATTTASLPGYNLSHQVGVAGGAVLTVPTGNGSNGWSSTQIGSLLADVAWSNSTAAFGIDTTSGNFTYGGNITQALALTKLGANSLTLTGSNTYPGVTAINGGTLSLGSPGALGAGNITFGGGILQFTSSNSTDYSAQLKNSTAAPISIDTNGQAVTFASPIGSSNTAGLVKAGNGTLALGASNSYTGGTILSGGTLVAAGNSALGSGPVSLWPSSGTATLAFTSAAPSIGSLASSGAGFSSVVLGNAAPSTATLLTVGANNASTTFSGAIGDLSLTASGTVGSLVKTGSGTLTLAGVNSYSGTTTVMAGVISVAGTASLPGYSTSNKVGVAGGAGLTVQTGNGSTGWSSAQITSLLGNTAWSSSTAAFGIDTTNGNFTYGGSITQALGLTKLGANTLTLTGSNTSYPGATLVSAGSLQVGDGASGYDVSLATNGMTDNAAVLYNVFGSQTANYTINGSGSLTKLGAGKLTLGGSNTYSGNTLISRGTLQLGSNLALQQSALDTTGTGALAFSSGINTPTFGGLTGARNLTLPASVTALTLDLGSGVSQTYSGALGSAKSGSSMTLTIIGAGTQVLSGMNTYTGATTVSGGTLVAANHLLSSSFSVAGGAGLTVRTGNGTAGWSTAQITSLLAGSWANNTAVLGLDTSNGNFTYGGNITQTLGLSKLGANTLTLTGSNTYSGATTVAAGVLDVAGTASLPGYNVPNTVSVAGGGVLAVQSGNGTAGWSSVQISSLLADTSWANSTAALGLDTTNGNVTYGGNITQPVGLTKLGANTLALTGSNTYSGATAVAAGVLNVASTASLPSYNVFNAVSVAGGAVLAVQSGNGATGWSGAQIASLLANTSWANSTAALGLDTSNGNFTYGGNITQAVGLTKLGANTLTLTGGDTYAGGTTISAGALNFNADAALGVLSAPLTFTGSGTLQAGANGILLNSARNIAINNGAAATIDTQTYSMEIDGTIGGAGGLTKVGPGTLTLTAANSFAGGTTLSGGVLSVAALNDTAASNLGPAGTLALSGGTLQYTGTGDTTSRTVNAQAPPPYTVGGAIQVLNPTANLIFTGQVLGGPFSKTGPGTLTLAGDADNGGAYPFVLQGTLVLAKAANTGHGVSSVGGVSPGATLQLGGGGGRQIYGSVNNMNGTFDLNGQSQGCVGLTGSGTVTNSAGSTTSTLTFGWVDYGWQPNTAGYVVSSTFPGVIADGQGAMALVVSGGTCNDSNNNNAVTSYGALLTLTGTNNTYSGGTTISAGTLQIGDGISSPGSLPGNVVASALTYSTTNGAVTASGALSFNTPALMSITYSGNISGSGSGGLTKTGAGLLTLSGSNTFTGTTTLSAGNLAYASLSAVSSTSNILINSPGAVNVGGPYPTVMGWLNSNLVNPASTGILALAGSSNESVSMAGYSGLSLGAVAGGATYGGSLTPAGSTYCLGGGGGALTVSTALTGGNGLAAFGAGAGGTLILTGSNSYSGGTTIGSGGLLVFNSAAGQVLNGAISGGGSLTQQGPGTLTLGGWNTYSGVTTVNGGGLAVNGALTVSAVNVNPAGLLSGTGLVGNLIHVGSGGVLAPGNSGGGTLTAGDVTLDSGGILNYTLGNGGFLNVLGAMTLPISGAPGTLNLYGSGATAGTYPLFSCRWVNVPASSALTIGVTPAALAGDTFSLTTVGNTVDLVISASNGGTWNTNGSGTWSTSSNWSGGLPGGGQGTAVFGPVLAAGTTATVTLDSSQGLGSLGFSPTGGAGYVIGASGGSTLTLANTATGTATLGTSGGNNTINAPITLGSGLSVSTSAGSVLTVGQTIGESGGSQLVTVSGDGELILSGTDSYTGGTTVSGGTLEFSAASAVPGSGLVTIGGSGRLELGTGLGSGSGGDLESGSLLAASSPVGSDLAAPGSIVPEPAAVPLLLAAGLGGLVIWLSTPRQAKHGAAQR